MSKVPHLNSLPAGHLYERGGVSFTLMWLCYDNLTHRDQLSCVAARMHHFPAVEVVTAISHKQCHLGLSITSQAAMPSVFTLLLGTVCLAAMLTSL